MLVFMRTAISFYCMFFFFTCGFGSIMSGIRSFGRFHWWITCFFKFIVHFFALHGFLNLEHPNRPIEILGLSFLTLCAPAFRASILNAFNNNKKRVDIRFDQYNERSSVYIQREREVWLRFTAMTQFLSLNHSQIEKKKKLRQWTHWHFSYREKKIVRRSMIFWDLLLLTRYKKKRFFFPFIPTKRNRTEKFYLIVLVVS